MVGPDAAANSVADKEQPVLESRAFVINLDHARISHSLIGRDQQPNPRAAATGQGGCEKVTTLIRRDYDPSQAICGRNLQRARLFARKNK
jgi:hypothetical protein